MDSFTQDRGLLPSDAIEYCIEDMLHLVINTANKYHIETTHAIQIIDLAIKLIDADNTARTLGDIEERIDVLADTVSNISCVLG